MEPEAEPLTAALAADEPTAEEEMLELTVTMVVEGEATMAELTEPKAVAVLL